MQHPVPTLGALSGTPQDRRTLESEDRGHSSNGEAGVWTSGVALALRMLDALSRAHGDLTGVACQPSMLTCRRTCRPAYAMYGHIRTRFAEADEHPVGESSGAD